MPLSFMLTLSLKETVREKEEKAHVPIHTVQKRGWLK